MGHDIWFTVLLNKLLAGVVTPALMALGVAPADPAHPISNYTAMEIMVFVILVGGALILRAGLSVENPGTFQQVMEVAVEFVQNLVSEIIGPDSSQYVPLIGTLGLFILVSNVLGLVPTLETPTGYIPVTLGCAVAVFIYYNYQGVHHHGALGYLKTFWGPIWWVGFLLFPVEVVSNLFRLLSLSVRLFANMFVGKLLEQVFASLAADLSGAILPLRVFGQVLAVTAPASMMALHLFVSFVQAYIFMLLPAVYISLATAEEH
jgi:F-type H+-transporting ATPase subunit a